MQHRRTGTKLALKAVHVWGIRIRLQVARKLRDLALFDLALDSKLRACDHTKLESTVRYLGVEVDDALELSEALEL